MNGNHGGNGHGNNGHNGHDGLVLVPCPCCGGRLFLFDDGIGRSSYSWRWSCLNCGREWSLAAVSFRVSVPVKVGRAAVRK